MSDLNWDRDVTLTLVNIARLVADMPHLPNIREACMVDLANIDNDLWKQLYPEAAAEKEKAEEERIKAEEAAAEQKVLEKEDA